MTTERRTSDASIRDADLLTPLVRRLQSADSVSSAKAMTDLLRRLRPPIRRFVHKRLNAFPAADQLRDEITQEVLVKISARIQNLAFANDAALMKWCLEVARTTAIDSLRVSDEEAHSQHLRLNGVDAEDERWEEWGDGDEQFWTSGLGRSVRDAYDALPEFIAELVWLHLVVEASWRESAAALGISPKAAQNRYYRAVTQLRKTVQERHRLDAARASGGRGIRSSYAGSHNEVEAPSREERRI